MAVPHSILSSSAMSSGIALRLSSSFNASHNICPIRYCFHEYFSIQAPIRQRPLASSSLTGSAKLFADAASEESSDDIKSSKSAKLQFLENRVVNWTGDERIEDAVLRMLVDKYKPLRSGTIQTAEQRLKKNPPVVAASVGSYSTHDEDNGHLRGGDETAKAPTDNMIANNPLTGSWASEPLIPSIEGHRPWHTTFRVPSHATPSIRAATLPPTSPLPRSTKTNNNVSEERLKKLEKQAKKRTEQIGRLANARESTLDYRLGIRGTRLMVGQAGPNPVSVKGWASLVEDKIEKARIKGLFNSVKGRGQPMVRSSDEHNPFIAREEFLMNRIVQKNGAAPPWVEIQQEMESAINSFREITRQAWIRHALRTLTIGFHSYPGSHRPSLAEVISLRDTAWEERECSYHDAALSEINALVRKYNAVAPYAVRRPLYTRVVELERMYKESGEEIMKGLEERRNATSGGRLNDGQVLGDEEKEGGGGYWAKEDTDALRLRDVFRRWVRKLTALTRWK